MPRFWYDGVGAKLSPPQGGHREELQPDAREGCRDQRPHLDVKDGRVVKGVNFVGLRDAGDPVALASAYDAQGADEICFLDITASSDNRDIILDVVSATAKQIFVPLTVGGGVRVVEDIRRLLNAGADKVSINTAAVQQPEIIAEASALVGSQCIVVAIDARRVDADHWEVYTHGGRTPTGLDALAWAKQVQAAGAGEILLTSMDRDGTQEGYDLELTGRFARELTIPVIASGGVGRLEHLYDGFAVAEADAVLAASIFHYGTYSIPEVRDYLIQRGICVRPVSEAVAAQ